MVLALGNKEQDGAWGFRPDGSHGNKKTAKHFTAKKIFLEQVIAGTSSFEFVKVHHSSTGLASRGNMSGMTPV